MVLPEDNGLESDPMPIMPSAGAALGYSIFGSLGVELSLDFYGTYYGYSEKLDRVIPVNPENRSSFVIGSVLGLQLLGIFNLTDSVWFRVYGGPGADLRLCLIAGGLEGEEREMVAREVNAIASYFWNQSRWFLPVFGMGIDYDLNEKIRLGFDTRVWFPVYRRWTGENLPAVEGWRFSAGFKLTLLN
jgi:hypothetical protein